MSVHSPVGQEGDSTADFSDGPGRRLRVARQALGFDLDRVAGELHLRPSLVESLEHDDYESLPAQVYVSGYIRKYARLVGLDPGPLLASFSAAASHTAPLRSYKTPTVSPQIGSGHLVVRLIGIGILTLLAGLSYVWWQGQRSATDVETPGTEVGQDREVATVSEPTPNSQTPAAVDWDPNASPVAGQLPEVQDSLPAQSPASVAEEPVAGSVASTAEAANNDNAANGQVDVADSAVADTDRVSAVPQVESEDTDRVPAAATAEIVMSFEGPCWVDVRDSKREYKLFGEMKKGDRYVLEGEPPYSFILGNAAAVQITVGGAVFDLSAKSRGNVARFTLDPGELP